MAARSDHIEDLFVIAGSMLVLPGALDAVHRFARKNPSSPGLEALRGQVSDLLPPDLAKDHSLVQPRPLRQHLGVRGYLMGTAAPYLNPLQERHLTIHSADAISGAIRTCRSGNIQYDSGLSRNCLLSIWPNSPFRSASDCRADRTLRCPTSIHVEIFHSRAPRQLQRLARGYLQKRDSLGSSSSSHQRLARQTQSSFHASGGVAAIHGAGLALYRERSFAQ